MLAKRALKTLRWYPQSLVTRRYSSTGHHVTNDQVQMTSYVSNERELIKWELTQIRFSRHHKWNKAVAEAEALVGFPTSMDAMQMLAASNDSSSSISMTAYIKKLMASDHPVCIIT